ncbi:hypothetical protein DFH09DRAFT_1083978 [Mycena vulgaris]|nr:hypothetical protein DFH09DRAFT_1083978 [Mycena vulgaris]
MTVEIVVNGHLEAGVAGRWRWKWRRQHTQKSMPCRAPSSRCCYRWRTGRPRGDAAAPRSRRGLDQELPVLHPGARVPPVSVFDRVERAEEEVEETHLRRRNATYHARQITLKLDKALLESALRRRCGYEGVSNVVVEKRIDGR